MGHVYIPHKPITACHCGTFALLSILRCGIIKPGLVLACFHSTRGAQLCGDNFNSVLKCSSSRFLKVSSVDVHPISILLAREIVRLPEVFEFKVSERKPRWTYIPFRFFSLVKLFVCLRCSSSRFPKVSSVDVHPISILLAREVVRLPEVFEFKISEGNLGGRTSHFDSSRS